MPPHVRPRRPLRRSASRRALACAGGLALGAAGALAAEPGPDLCEGLPAHSDRVPVSPVKKPPFAKRYRDPAFGTTVMRITDAAPDAVFKPPYSTMQAWNADESLLLLYRKQGRRTGHVLLDGTTYEIVQELDIVPSDLEEIFWSHTDPDTFFYVSKQRHDFGQFRRYDVSTGEIETIADFAEHCGPRGMPTSGGGVHMQSLDDDLFGFRCRPGDARDEYVAISYRISTDETHVMPIGKDTPWRPWSAPVPAPSGDRMYFQGSVVSTDLETVIHELDMGKDAEHANIGLAHDGSDAIFQVAFDPSPDGCDGGRDDGVGHVVEHDLESGKCRQMVGEAQGWPYTTTSTHISAQAWKRPGWVAVSSVGIGFFDWFTDPKPAPALFSEIYLVDTDPDNVRVCRVAQHRSFGKAAERGDYNPYFAEPHATISPSGTRILFGSDWYDSGSVDTYVVELPAYERPSS